MTYLNLVAAVFFSLTSYQMAGICCDTRGWPRKVAAGVLTVGCGMASGWFLYGVLY